MVNNNFADIPVKAQFSKSEEAKMLIQKIKSAINDINDLNYKYACKLRSEAIELIKEVADKKRFWEQNYVCRHAGFNVPLNGNYLNIYDLCEKLKNQKK